MDLEVLRDTPPWEWPAGAAGTILEILGDDRAEPARRLLAAELAGDFSVINDELAEALLAIARGSDEPEELRGEAAVSLGPALEYADIEGFEDPDAVTISEQTFRKIQESLRELYLNADVPEVVRRRVLESSVHAPQDWHPDAVRAAYSSGDEIWRLTAVFCMRYLRGFDDQILEALGSKNEDIHYEAVCAAGNWGVDAAWSHVARLVTSKGTDKATLLAAMDALAGIRPREAGAILVGLTDSDDEDIVEAAHEAMTMAEGLSEIEDDDEEEEDEEKLLH
jgi:hypothetical protein